MSASFHILFASQMARQSVIVGESADWLAAGVIVMRMMTLKLRGL